jgi:hypothetical protein
MISLLLLGAALLLAFNKAFQKAFEEWLIRWIEILQKLYKAWQKRKRERWKRENPDKLFSIEQTFMAQTLSGFDVSYRMILQCERIDVPRTIKEEVENRFVQKGLAYEFRDKVFLPHFERMSYFWHLDYGIVAAAGSQFQVRPTIVGEIGEEDGCRVVRSVPCGRIQIEVEHLRPMEIRGCRIRLLDFSTLALSDEMIERNYRVLSDQQIKAILGTAEFSAAGEMFAVALLKRRLDFLRDGSRTYTADLFTIETEKAGRTLNIRWRFKAGAENCFLWGFRNTDGFSNDQWDENKNGKRVIDSYKDGEDLQVLDEGVAYFYTFFLVPYREDAEHLRKSLLRFQVTISLEKEIETISKALLDIEGRKPVDPTEANLNEALNAVGAIVEMDKAFEAMEKRFSEDIMKSDRPQAEKRRKIERLRDVIRQIRSRYESSTLTP